MAPDPLSRSGSPEDLTGSADDAAPPEDAAPRVPDSAEPDGAEPGGAEPDSAKPDGAEPDGAEPDGAAAEQEPPGLDELAERVRHRVAVLATGVLDELGVAQLPVRVRPFARFAARRRAALAAPAVLAALASDSVFRQRVAEHLPEPAPDAPPDPARAWLTRSEGWEAVLAPALAGAARTGAGAGPGAGPRRGPDARPGDATRPGTGHAEREAARLARELVVLRTRARADRQDAQALADRLRRELTTATGRAQRAERAAARDRERADALAGELTAAQAAAQADRSSAAAAQRRLRHRVEELTDQVAGDRRAARRERGVSDTRLRLLLDTVIGAAHGLAGELALPAGPGALPADTVEAVEPGGPGAAGGNAVARWDDPAWFTSLLSLPAAHLVVDGYNVTKAAVPTLTLAEQRSQLLRVLAALATQTGAEVTAVFDGADVTAVPAAAARGVRVRFSPPGVTADAVIRTMARAEPAGRPVVVVSSDREVARGVEAAGAWAAPSSVLTARLLAGRPV